MSIISNSQGVVVNRIDPLTRTLDNGMMNSKISREFNTYRNWSEFELEINKSPNSQEYEAVDNPANGVKSLFNNVNAVVSDRSVGSSTYRVSNNIPLMDTPSKRIQIRNRSKCTIKDLVENSEKGLMGRQVYDYSDFAYCTHLGKLSNNHLITLRRFPVPCGDNIFYHDPNDENEKITQSHLPDMGRLVTWMGTPGNEMDKLLKYNLKMNWKDNKSDFQDVGSEADSSSPLAQMFNAADPTYRKQVVQGYAGTGQTFLGNGSFFGITGALGKIPGVGKHLENGIRNSASGINSPPYSNVDLHHDSNKVYGPLDVIQRVKIRDRGLEVDQKFTLTFDYQLRSYDGINGKSAMLDLLGNILAVTYNNGKFWGGAYKGGRVHQSSLFTNLPIFKAAKTGDASAVIQSFSSSIAQIGSHIRSQGNGNLLSGLANIVKGIGGMLLGGMLNKLGRPQKMSANSLLVNAPTGLWHLTIGNPMAPIMSVGNLCLTNAEIEHYGPLGIDDFPTGIKVTVSLEPGMDRDSAGIERMYLKGDNRYYWPVDKNIIKMYDISKSISKNKNQSDETSVIDQVSSEVKKAASLLSGEDENSIDFVDNAGLNEKDKQRLIKFFGTDNINSINITAKEAFRGSVPDSKNSKKDSKGKNKSTKK